MQEFEKPTEAEADTGEYRKVESPRSRTSTDRNGPGLVWKPVQQSSTDLIVSSWSVGIRISTFQPN